MIIENKFEPRQEVWVMQNNKPIKLFVDSININIGLDSDKKIKYGITYNLFNGSFGGRFKENEIYATKEDLKNSIFK